MKPRPKLNKSEIPRDELQKHFPKDKPWILFLGTSHTHGSCETGVEGEEVLEDHERYTGRLKTKFPDYEIVNLAIPGNNNMVMLQQLCELNEYGIDVSNLKLVMAETRVGDPSGVFCSDNYRDFNVHHDKHPNSLIAKGSDIWHKQVRDEWLSHYATGGKMDNSKYLPNLISSHFDGNPPQSAIKRLGEYIRLREEFYHSSIHTFIDDLDKIRAMQNIVRLMGAKFRWFHLDNPPNLGNSNRITVIDYYKKWSNLWEDWCLFELEGITDHMMGGIKNLMVQAFTNDICEERFTCKCRHVNSEGNEIIAELLYKEIKTCLNN